MSTREHTNGVVTIERKQVLFWDSRKEGRSSLKRMRKKKLFYQAPWKETCCWTKTLKTTISYQPSEESQNSWGWNKALEVVWSNSPAQARPPEAGWPGPCPGSFLISSRMESPQPLSATCASAWSPPQWKNVFWCVEGTSCVSVCAHCFWSCHWAPLKRAWLCPLCTLPSGIYIH